MDAKQRGVAVGHFNISNLEMLHGIVSAARKLNVPVIIGTSEGEADFIGMRQAVAVVKSLREELSFPIFINADHTYSVERVKEAIDAGYDSVIFDGAGISIEENIVQTKQCVAYARASGRDVLVEAELGFIGKSSKVHDVMPEGINLSADSLTKPEDAVYFVAETGIDMLAPAVGNMHGMLKGGIDPSLNIDCIQKLADALSIPMVLHGGSGNSKDDFKEAVKRGMSVVHVSTEIRVAYKSALKLALQENPEEVAPYKYLKETVRAVEKVVEEKLKIFNNLS